MKDGTIVNVLSKDNFLYAMIVGEDKQTVDERGDLLDDGNAIFNYTPDKNRALLYIRTDVKIDSMTDPRSYIGAEVDVLVNNGIAYQAYLRPKDDSMIFSKNYLNKLMLSNDKGELFTKANEEQMKLDGFSADQIKALKENVITEEEEKGSMVVVGEEQALGWRTILKKADEMVYLTKAQIVGFNHINSDGMKTNNCHIPSVAFSAK